MAIYRVNELSRQPIGGFHQARPQWHFRAESLEQAVEKIKMLIISWGGYPTPGQTKQNWFTGADKNYLLIINRVVDTQLDSILTNEI